MTTFRNEDLVLRVGTDYDPNLIRLDKYEAFIDALCGDREYQKEAVRTSCRLLAGGQYASTADLAEQNYAPNPVLVERYGSLSGLMDALPFRDKLAGCIDLATGTGKSWVMYGVARILLAEGVVDRVLLLCPSLTIEAGLTVKFHQFTADATLRDLIPEDAIFRNPEIKDANETTGPGDICIENIEATYKHVRSSVRDSFAGVGSTTLVLNDETHHVFSPPTGRRAIRRWKEFLDSPEFGFTRILGLSGTCYVENEYFPDVVSRYSLRQAMDDGRVKEVRYVSKDESINQDERFQKYLHLHRENQKRYRSRKPLTILVTATISGAKTLGQDLTRFLREAEGISATEAEDRVLVVTSDKDHKANVARLPYVDRPDDPVEWIVSVSMLTEGWDVQNVFQVVPHEKRAFRSKLLIAQVLGRGLRVPRGLSRPAVWVFNHSSWSSEIADLVAEVLEQERRLHSYPVDGGEHRKHHFRLHQLTYNTRTTEQTLKPKSGSGQVQLFKRGYVNFETQPEDLERITTFEGALDQREYAQRTRVHYKTYTVDQAVQALRRRLKSIDAEGDTTYAKEYSATKLRKVIEASLSRIREKRGVITEHNLQHAYRALGNTQRKVNKAVRVELDPDQLIQVDTRDMRVRSVAVSSFRKEATVFYDSESGTLSEDADRGALGEITDPDAPYPRHAAREVANKFHFKSPVNIVLTSHEPERAFVRRLFEPQIVERVEAWIKAPDAGFYEIGYSWRRGDHTKLARFNPDVFIKLSDSSDVLVIELKGDGDDSDENRAKLRFARDHFERINEVQSEARYHMKFLSPASYDAFFQALRDGTAVTFQSALQTALEA